MRDKRLEMADELLRRLAAAVRSSQLYSAGHPTTVRNLELLTDTVGFLHASQSAVTVGLVESELVVGETPIGKSETFGDLVRRLRASGVERITIERGVAADELALLVRTLGVAEPRKGGAGEPDAQSPLTTLPHIRVGRIHVEERVSSDLADMPTIRRLYANAVSAARVVWDSATSDRTPDATAARAMIDGLTQAVSQNRTALVALTALQQYDNYTFTHMVNVSILTMAQARTVGIDGPLLREFGLAALMHDIGKVKTPTDILTKPDSLTDAEFTIMKRHTVDGAEMLRRTPDISTLVPVVAFEHHLRLDGSGYPHGISRTSLNLCTMLCSIADVYDAMRSQRLYQQAFPTDRIVAVLKRNDGTQFDQHLVRRFVQLLGIYPPGNLVELDNGEVAVVLKAHAPDPHRPQVRVVFDRNGVRLKTTHDVNLWDALPDEDGPSSVRRPIDPTPYGLDPLTLM